MLPPSLIAAIALVTTAMAAEDAICEYGPIPTTPCGSGCIRNDSLETGALECVDGACQLADPLPEELQQLIDIGVADFSDGCWEASTPTGPTVTKPAAEVATTVAPTPVPSQSPSRSGPTSDAAAALSLSPLFLGTLVLGFISL